MCTVLRNHPFATSANFHKAELLQEGIFFLILVSLISNFFSNKTSPANKWMSFSSSNSALEQFFLTVGQNNFGNKIPFRMKGKGSKN